jgi:hypothetical protein
MRCSGQKHIAIIIDALDEGYNTDLLALLRDKVPKLPTTFRIFLTSRADEEIVSFLSQDKHIRGEHQYTHQAQLDGYPHARNRL